MEEKEREEKIKKMEITRIQKTREQFTYRERRAGAESMNDIPLEKI